MTLILDFSMDSGVFWKLRSLAYFMSKLRLRTVARKFLIILQRGFSIELMQNSEKRKIQMGIHSLLPLNAL